MEIGADDTSRSSRQSLAGAFRGIELGRRSIRAGCVERASHRGVMTTPTLFKAPLRRSRDLRLRFEQVRRAEPAQICF
jgi:hypothetical protein